jgi:general secretion pathway protein G
MKKNHLLLCVPSLVLLVLLAAFNYGCGKKETPPPAPPKPATAQTAPALVSVEKTSFTEVTSQLDPGGNFYLYLGTAQWLDGLAAKVGAWRQTFLGMPGLKPDNTNNVNKAFDIVTRLIQDSGIEDVSGVGLSSVEFEKGVFRNRALLHHYPGKGNGFLWQLAGKEPHPLTGLDCLPADTALAIFSDLDLPVLWAVAQKEVAQSDLPQAQEWLKKLPADFEQKTGIKWDDFIHSLGGEFGLVMTLDPSNNVPVPLPGGVLQIPAPGLLIAVKVNDDTIFNCIDQRLKANPQVVSVDKPGLKMRTMPVPLPLPITLRPSAASSGGYLFIATSDTLIDDALAVKSGQKSGLKATDEFKHLAQGLPDRGNQFAYVSRRFAQTLVQIQQQVVASNTKADPNASQWLQSFCRNRPTFAYSVGINTPEGCLTIGNGSQSYADTVLLPAVAVPAMLAAIAVPNFVKARATSQRNACINNLRQLDAAKQEWALEKGKQSTDTPTMDDLKPYLRKIPHCPAGGTYTINAVGQPPECSIPGHKLP